MNQNTSENAMPINPQTPQPIPNHIPSQRNKSSKPVIAGSLLFIVGIIGIIFSGIVIGGGLIMDSIEDIPFQGFSVTSMDGTIIDSSGNPVSDVTITLVGSHLETRTNENGSYRIQGIPSGYHQIRIEKEGYNTVVYNTYIISGNDFSGFMGENEQIKNDPLINDDGTYDFQISQGNETYEYGSETPPHQLFFEKFGGWISGFGVITLFCSILSIVGGYFSLMRKNHIFVILCSIAAIFSFGFFIGSLLAIIALIIVILSSNEFEEKPLRRAS